ncbi:hypothetical protein [Bradyrhizobium sp. STM 3809]|uniref:hypothetical protein n=1 Tax=Bradyrhizobium sp. STM 3809 TaxID=551936 RepID=UPI001F0A5562|nr:hypothetical protein [Bradyrhizobium sp. STM 3809]
MPVVVTVGNGIEDERLSGFSPAVGNLFGAVRIVQHGCNNGDPAVEPDRRDEMKHPT